MQIESLQKSLNGIMDLGMKWLSAKCHDNVLFIYMQK
jgi:hypothetical protein